MVKAIWPSHPFVSLYKTFLSVTNAGCILVRCVPGIKTLDYPPCHLNSHFFSKLKISIMQGLGPIQYYSQPSPLAVEHTQQSKRKANERGKRFTDWWPKLPQDDLATKAALSILLSLSKQEKQRDSPNWLESWWSIHVSGQILWENPGFILQGWRFSQNQEGWISCRRHSNACCCSAAWSCAGYCSR